MSAEKKSESPSQLKSMDIKSLFLSAVNRKRKAPLISSDEKPVKNLRRSEDVEKVENEDVLSSESKENINTVVNVKPASGEISPITKKLHNALSEELQNAAENNASSSFINDNLSNKENHIDGQECLDNQRDISGTSHNLQNESELTNLDDSVNDVKEPNLDDSLNEAESTNLDSSVNDENLDDSINTAEDPNSESLVNEPESINSLKSSHNDLGDNKLSDNKDQTTQGTESRPKRTASEKQDNQNEQKTKKKKRKMTPEEAKKRAEERELKNNERLLKKQLIEEKKEERRLERETIQRRKEQEKKEKEDEKKEKERIRLEKKDQEEKEKQLRMKERDEKIKQKQFMNEQKQEEKKKKEEMKKVRDEELKKAEEEKQKTKLEKEQKEKEKKEKAKAAFIKFFHKGTNNVQSSSVPQVEKTECVFKPFQVSEDMTLANVVPTIAQERFNKENLDRLFETQERDELYLQDLKSGIYEDIRLRRREKKQKKLCDADVILVDSNAPPQINMTAKLFQFCENVRPPYWGTWRKKSRKVHGRKPFGTYEHFDYEVDSDDEWDEGGPGESLSGTENEVESEDDYEVDNEFFVPHGYLSAEEEKEEDEITNDPEKQKAVLKIKLQEFETERKRKTEELKPIILGCHFVNDSTLRDSSLRVILETYTAIMTSEDAIPTRFTVKSESNSNANSPVDKRKNKKSFIKVPEEAMPHLVRLIHGNVNGMSRLITEFQEFWKQHCEQVNENNPQVDRSPSNVPQDREIKTDAAQSVENSVQEMSSNENLSSNVISKRQLKIIFKQIATYGRYAEQKRFIWFVNEETRGKYGLIDAPVPNTWKYITTTDEASIAQKPPQIVAI